MSLQLAKLESLLVRIKSNANQLAQQRAALPEPEAAQVRAPVYEPAPVAAPPPAPQLDPPAHAAVPEAEEPGQLELSADDLVVGLEPEEVSARPSVIPVDAPEAEDAETLMPPASRASLISSPSLKQDPLPDLEFDEPLSPPPQAEQSEPSERHYETRDHSSPHLSARLAQEAAEADSEDEEMPPSGELEEVDTIAGSEAIVEDPEARTPPPESGPIVSAPPQAQERPAAPEFDIDMDAPVSLPGKGPTMAQLGTTVDLDSPAGMTDDLELDAPLESRASHELDLTTEESFEEELPPGGFAGGYDDSLELPPSARDRLRGFEEADTSGQELEFSEPVAPAPTMPAPTSARAEQPTPDRVERPASEHFYPEVVAGAPAAPRTFGSLFAASVALGKKS